MKKILVADVMTRNPVTAKPGDSLFDCAKKMVRKQLGSLVLSEKDKVDGFLSQKDILWALVKKPNVNLKKVLAKDISPKKVVTVRSSDTVDSVIKILKKKKFKRLPVINKNKELVGVVSARDVLSFNPEMYPELEEFAQIREEQEKLKRVKGAQSRVIDEEGICEECGSRGIVFYKINGLLICENCESSI